MLNVTELASAKLQEYCTANNVEEPIRVALMGGCCGSSLGLAIDGEKETDTVVELGDGCRMIVDNELLQQCGAITVDFADNTYRPGFTVSSTNPVGKGDGCGSSAGGCSSGSCSSGSCGC
ncbi:MAG: IscA/HesB family protein [Thermodesulfobacteriota bacterium]